MTVCACVGRGVGGGEGEEGVCVHALVSFDELYFPSAFFGISFSNAMFFAIRFSNSVVCLRGGRKGRAA